MARGRPENFKPRSTVEARKNGQKGGVRSGEARREKKRLRELLELALERKGDDGQTTAEAVTAALVAKALTGDVKAYEVIRDTVGEKPTDKVAQDTTLEIRWQS